jgi:uncharacterized protein with HEPN domain
MPKLSEILGEAYSQIPEDIQNKYKEVDLVDSSDYIAKTEYDNVNGQLDTANKTIKDLKKNNVDNEALQNTIKAHEKTIADKEAENIEIRKESAVRLALKGAGCNDEDYFMFKHKDKIEFDENNTPKNLDSIISAERESKSLLFSNTVSGNPPRDGKSDPTPKDTRKMSYIELCKHLEENPNAQI